MATGLIDGTINSQRAEEEAPEHDLNSQGEQGYRRNHQSGAGHGIQGAKAGFHP